jgi:hypothetical protein
LSTTLNLNAIDFPTIASSFGQGEPFKSLAQASVPGCSTSWLIPLACFWGTWYDSMCDDFLSQAF